MPDMESSGFVSRKQCSCGNIVCVKTVRKEKMTRMRKKGSRINRTVVSCAIALTLFCAGGEMMSTTAYAATEEDYNFSNPTWDISDHVLMAYWDQSETDQRYRLDLYRDQVSDATRISRPRTVSHKDFCDFTKEIQNYGAGNYIFTVTGLKNNETIASDVLHLSWEDFHEIQDRYREEHPKSVSGAYQTPELDRINGVTRPYVQRNDGWVKLKDGNWYHFNGQKMDTGWFQDSNTGKKYYLQANGIMITGWAYIEGKTWLFGQDGALKNGG